MVAGRIKFHLIVSHFHITCETRGFTPEPQENTCNLSKFIFSFGENVVEGFAPRSFTRGVKNHSTRCGHGGYFPNSSPGYHVPQLRVSQDPFLLFRVQVGERNYISSGTKFLMGCKNIQTGLLIFS